MINQEALNQTTKQDSFKYAGFGRRLLAYTIDGGIIFFIVQIIQIMLGHNYLLSIMEIQTLEELQQLQASSSSSLIALFSLLFSLFYYLIFWVNYDGATPGKRLMAIKIIKDDGSKLTYSVSIIRYFGIILSSLPLGLGFFWVIWDKKKQGWHDKIAKTLVVKTEVKPKTFLAIFLFIIVNLSFLTYFGISMYYGYNLGMQEYTKAENELYTGKSFNKSMEEMTPEALVHFERSQELFEQMRDQANNPDTVRQLNDENILELKMAIELEPNNPRLWLDLGSAYTWISSEGSLKDGLEADKKAEELDPENVVYINNVGDMLIRMGKYEEAILQFQKTLRLTDKSGYANLSLGMAYQELRIVDSAKEHFQKAIDIFTSQNDDGKFDDEILNARKRMSELSQ
jgi:uncharacterized RDD family membrane protein YckC